MITSFHVRCTRTLAAGLVASFGLFGGALSGWGIGPQCLAAQDTTRVTSPLLLKRIAEALDGYRTGADAYVVASYAYPNLVAGIFDSRREAQGALGSAGAQNAVFGPYRTSRDRDLSPQMVVCIHRMSLMDPRERYCGGGELGAVSDVDSLVVTIWVKKGPTRRQVLPKGTDAVFFTLAAVDKFAMPYYTHVLGVVETNRMRQELVERMRDR
jgi:hypothetical protein